MRRIQHLIAIPYGVAKAPAVRAALLSGMVNTSSPTCPWLRSCSPTRIRRAGLMPDRLTEVPLVGGTNNRGLVVRRGDTVRRPLRPTSPAAHALLTYLAEVGFDGAPRLLGIDDQGREVLTFIPGDAVTPPYPAWALTDDALRSVAVLLRRYHEAVAGFDTAAPRLAGGGTAGVRRGLACHNDLNLDNVIFRDGRPRP